MIPLMFGPEARRKYGVFQPAIGKGSKGRGVVICDGLFDEAVCAHRALRFAAGSMAEARWSSLRFDYFGTGDSSGDTGDFTLAGALADAHDAVDELKASAGLASVYLLGLRLGGALAAQVAATRDDVRGLLLWDPLMEGEEVLGRYGISGPADESAMIEGFSLSPGLQDELRGLSVERTLAAYAGPLLMICTAANDGHRRLAAGHSHIDFREIEAPEAWSNTALGGMRPIPSAVVNELREWPG